MEEHDVQLDTAQGQGHHQLQARPRAVSKPLRQTQSVLSSHAKGCPKGAYTHWVGLRLHTKMQSTN